VSRWDLYDRASGSVRCDWKSVLGSDWCFDGSAEGLQRYEMAPGEDQTEFEERVERFCLR